MRLIMKLSAIVLLGVVVQFGIDRCADQLDEAIFIVRVCVAQAQGAENDDPRLLIAASHLFRRQCARHDVTVPKFWHEDNAQLASVNDL